MTPADELHTAAATMRALPGPAAEPIARLLDALASSAHDEGAPIADEALAAARAINGTQLAAATASRRAPLPHAERLDRFAQVIYEHWNPDRQWKDAHPDDQVAYRADAVVAIKAADTVAGVPYALPLRTDVYREVADRLSLFTELERAQAAGVAGIPSTVREWAERIDAETATAVQSPVDRAAFRQCITEETALGLGRELLRDGLDTFLRRLVGLENAQRILAEQWAAVLREAADRLDRKAATLTEGVEDLAAFVAKAQLAEAKVLRREAAELRRLADEARPAPDLAAAQQTTVVTHVHPAPGGVAGALRDTARFRLGRRV
ncbi:hypothetical protein ACFZCV_20775 [Streptomyces sp. NPDC007920]|uniref:hypothetical protein n=1 Tax=Streptomyces sp. NPDC007920 TaxID=3364794 RepID=UPI0036EB98B3